ncbi:ATP-binding cassette domain-containing protein [Haloarcula sp. H-GB4]|nr:ATP-binding cassette domain-containing protein [Haloarcula sp. H-GB4]MDQ2073229.1 ATP-binding cassette domain-containing protein [Haloarcula sp. H-GB4]
MSGGEQQMLAIGRALMDDPELLVLDEPTLGLAPVIIDNIGDAIETLNDQVQTLLLVELNATFPLRHAHRLSLLESGRVKLSSSAAEFQDNDYITEAYVGIH